MTDQTIKINREMLREAFQKSNWTMGFSTQLESLEFNLFGPFKPREYWACVDRRTGEVIAWRNRPNDPPVSDSTDGEWLKMREVFEVSEG